MDSTPLTIETVIRFAKQRRVRAFLIGVAMLTILAVFQVQRQAEDAHLCELYPNAKLSEAELYRLQIALIHEGLEEFSIPAEGKLFVPISKRLEYIKAIARQNEEPINYRKSEDNGQVAPNLFLPKSERDAITLATKKKNIEKTITRLPYVVEAIFEMDKPIGFSAFQKQQNRAVISLATKDDLPLTSDRAKTIKAIVRVAAGVDSEDIVMIDLKTGLIHDDSGGPKAGNVATLDTDVSETLRHCESRINEALATYPQIKATVAVTIQQPTPITASTGKSANSQPLDLGPYNPEILQAGANSVVKIDTANWSKPTTETNGGAAMSILTKVVSISIDVPENLVIDRIEPPQANLASDGKQPPGLDQEKFDAQFNELKSEITRKVESTLSATPTIKCKDEIAFNLIPAMTVPVESMENRVRRIAVENWPSGVVLFVGLILLVTVTRNSDPNPNTSTNQHSRVSQNSGSNASPIHDTEALSDSEIRLTQLIEKDPDAAARVIKSWIRDAA